SQVARFAYGTRALDLCCYTGGFSLNLARAGAAEVIGVDSSEAAVFRAQGNAGLNALTAVQFVRADVLEWLSQYQGESFDLVVLDPPRLAPNRKSKARALRAYFRYNESAMKVLKKGGL